MSLNEACQLWIEQRIDEELEQGQGKQKSLRQIGREIAAEIGRLFEAKVSPRTIEKRVERQRATNVATEEKQIETVGSNNLEKLEKLEKTWGGARTGAGRKPLQDTSDETLKVAVPTDEECRRLIAETKHYQDLIDKREAEERRLPPEKAAKYVCLDFRRSLYAMVDRLKKSHWWHPDFESEEEFFIFDEEVRREILSQFYIVQEFIQNHVEPERD